jgi:hypothetical protein
MLHVAMASGEPRASLRARFGPRRRAAAPQSGVLTTLMPWLSLAACVLLFVGASTLLGAGPSGPSGGALSFLRSPPAPPFRSEAGPPLPPAPPPAQCASLVSAFVAASDARAAGRRAAAASSPPLSNVSFFLHVPRTAGRTLLFCALKLGLPPSRRCSRSYDRLRVDPRAPPCELVSSHDDFRLAEALPGSPRLFTQLRDPVQRVLSAYEFAVEVAARGLGHRTARAERKASKAESRTDTAQVWPWRHLVPLMERDLDARAAARRDGSLRELRGPGYNCSVVMPLHEFIDHPMAQELIHDGATMQLLGLTAQPPGAGEGASEAEAAALRACARAGGAPAQALLDAAIARLRDDFAAVLLKERLRESVAVAAAVAGTPLAGPSWRSMRDSDDDAHKRALAAARTDAERAAADAAYDTKGKSRDTLAVAHAKCTARQREKAAARRKRGTQRLRFGDGTALRFERAELAPAVAAALAAANALDVRLHAEAARIFEARRQELAKAGRLEELPPETKG